jgi:hypothetical protein
MGARAARVGPKVGEGVLVTDLERFGKSLNQVFRLWGINPAGDQRGCSPL